jgi:hypothetical protein
MGSRFRIFPFGQVAVQGDPVQNPLGKNSEGLCLLTNDSDFARTFREFDDLEQVFWSCWTGDLKTMN